MFTPSAVIRTTPPCQRLPAPRQRGFVSVVVILFLIATVVFGLSQMLKISADNVVDGQRQSDSAAAFYLAESGLERATGTLYNALGGSFTEANCTGLAPSAPSSLGRGTVSLTAALPASSPCGGSGQPTCTQCKVTAVGNVGMATREVTQDINFTVRNGTTCNAATTNCQNSPVVWKLNLKNAAAVAGIGVFNLTYDGRGNNRATCDAASNCRLQQDVDSPAAGQDSTALMGNAVLTPAGATYPIYQTTTQNRNLAEVGVFFLGTVAPTLTGPTTAPGAAAYWERRNNQTAKTVGSGSSTVGGTNDGTFTSGGSCAAPSANVQTCTSWCYGGDTLVFSYAGAAAALTDELTSVTFGTNATVGQNIAMTRVSKYPTTLIAGAPSNVDAEIWYARNPNFSPSSTPLALNASSYKGRGTGAVGAAWTTSSAADTSISGTTLTVGAGFTGYPAQIISVGDTVVSTGVAANTTISAQLTSTETGGMATARGGRGTYQVSISQTVAGANNRAWTANSNVLNVTACTICFLASADAVSLTGLSAGRTINAAQAAPAGTYGRTEIAGGLGRYPISGAATRVGSNAALFVGTPGTTLYLPSTSSQAVAGMRIAVKTGTGVLAAAPGGTTVTAVSTPNAATGAFSLTTAPATALDGASLCGGTCAFFVPGATAETYFSIANPAVRWAAGFMCLKGVDITPQVVTSSTSSAGRWTEVIR